jgi:UDP-2,3-diacylglucosamine pyrophosphatase LpxH
VGDGAYTLALTVNRYLNIVRRRFGLAYWSLSSWAKYKVKKAVNHIGRFEELLSNEARRLDVSGVVCGHIHHAVIHNDFGVRYMNTGDWVESCTALVENHDGSYEIIRWADELRQLAFLERAAVLAPQAEASAA